MPLLRPGELATIHEIARIDLALVDERFLEGTEGLRGSRRAGGAVRWSTGLAELMADKPTSYDDVATSSDDVALLAFTSGTTGRPKATMHFHRDVLAICDTFSRHVLAAIARRRVHGDAAVRLHVRARRGAALPAPRGRVDGAGREGHARPSWPGSSTSSA